MTASKNIRYIPAVDHLRAYAALLVLLYHSVQLISHQIIWQGAAASSEPWPRTHNFFLTIIDEGHTGVALFIVLSGFIFTYGSAGRAIDYPTFLLNRVLRIYPLYVALSFVGLSAYMTQITPAQFLLSLVPLGNLAGGIPAGVYGGVFWTIAVEFQFYLIFPFLYRQLLQRGVPGLLPLFAFLIMARWSALLLGANPREFSYWTILGRLDQFLIGMVAAHVALRATLSNRPLRWLLPVGVAGLGGTLYAFNRAGGWPLVVSWKILWPDLEGFLWALIILGYLAVRHGRDGLISRGIAAVGAVSYSMYLTHMVVLTIIVSVHGALFYHKRRFPYLCAFINGVAYVFPVTLLVSTLSYHAIEKPFLTLRRRYVAPDDTPRADGTVTVS